MTSGDWGALLVEGTPFGRYRLIEVIGRGGMGEVWRAFDTDTRRVVALKLLPEHLAADRNFDARFRREAFAAASLNDPHVIPIHHFGEIDGRLYVDMRLINGEDLNTILGRGPLDHRRAAHIIEQIASALDEAHRIGLVHRDVKPSNILVGNNDFAYLIDFGIARATGESKITSVGAVIGTWAYLAPERVTSGQTDPRCDTYALTCVLYECLVGTQPFPGDSLEQQIGAHLMSPPPRPSVARPGVPDAFDDVIAKGMAKDPDDRFTGIVELAAAAVAASRAKASAPSKPAASKAVAAKAAAANPAASKAVAAKPAASKAVAAKPAAAKPVESKPVATPARSARTPATPPTPPSPKVADRLGIVMAASAVLAIIAVVIVAVILARGARDDRPVFDLSTQPIVAPAPTSNTGAFEVGCGPLTDAFGNERRDIPTTTDKWSVRSACEPTCVATALTSGGFPPDGKKKLIFDYVDDRWLTVSASQGTCQDRYVELWLVISMAPESDGVFSGDASYYAQDGSCGGTRSIRLVRTGDADLGGISDPATEAPRAASPAAAFRGRYDTLTRVIGQGNPTQTNLGVTTDCLRTGDRCITVMSDAEKKDPRIYVFGGGVWSRNQKTPATCAGRQPTTATITATIALPEPEQDPITEATGLSTIKSDCGSSDVSDRYTRTGD